MNASCRARARALALDLLILLLFAAVAAASASAQVRDTLRADTLTEPRDTTPPPAPVRVPQVRRGIGFGAGVWTWDKDALLRESAISLLDLLARVPGVTTFRSGVFLQPETAMHYGGGAARTIVELDGYVLDPLIAPTLDLSTIELVHVEDVRIERRADVLWIRLRSDAARDYRPYSRVEAGIGEPNANLFRGILITPRFLFGPIGLGVERFELEGAGRPQPADMFSAWVRWGWLSENRGIELELRSNRLRRDEGSPMPLELDRNDLILRLRNRFTDGVSAEAYVGRSQADARDLLEELDDSLRFLIDRSFVQAGGRLGADFGRGGGDVAVRWREDPAMPQLEYDANLEARPLDALLFTLGGTHQTWRGGSSATSWRGLGRIGPIGPVSVFGEFAGGKRGAPRPPDMTRWDIGERILVRGGLELELGPVRGGGAWVKVEADSIVAPGLPSDTLHHVLPAGEVTGWEWWGRIPVFRDWLYACGAYSVFTGGTRWAFLPASQLQATLELHSLPLPSGNLELFGRIDAIRRGPMLGPPDTLGAPVELPARTLINASFQLRIIDVRIFVRIDDWLGNDIEDVPGLPIQGPRVIYGVKWNFWN